MIVLKAAQEEVLGALKQSDGSATHRDLLPDNPMTSISKVIIVDKVRRCADLVRRPNPYCGFKNDTERRKALGTLVRWRACSVIAVSIGLTAANDTIHLQSLLSLLKQLTF
jgi:hypothetical protein